MNWRDERVVIIGAARQGTALARYLAGLGADVLLTDIRPADQIRAAQDELADLPITWVLGDHPPSLLVDATLVCPSGGVPLSIPLVKEAVRRGIPLSNDSQIFLEAAPCPVIGITGSAGKTTTTTLAGRMAQKAAEAGIFRQAFIGGNIGFPLIAQVDQMTDQDVAVVELSSFQLELMTRSPQVAALLNISPNHLDRHGTMQAYSVAKRNILAYQRREDTAVLGVQDSNVWSFSKQVAGRLFAFGRQIPQDQLGAFVRDDQIWVRTELAEQSVLTISEIELPGEHNLLNVLAACAVAAAAGIPAESMRAGVERFRGVEHRLEFVREWGGAHWYNDSKATSPGMTVTAMRAFTNPLIVLVGGRDKDLPWEEFASQAHAQVDHVIAFGEAAERVQSALSKTASNGRKYSLDICAGLDQAVDTAARLVNPGDVVLLAPGGTSFDEFTDYEARGRRFKDLVNSLPDKE